MTLLRGNSVTYTRFALPDEPRWGTLDEAVKFRTFMPLGGPEDERTERVGTCSWRNLLDGPVDHGWLPSQGAWVVGIRNDTKKAPPALFQAELARAMSDYSQTSGTRGMSKKEKKRITAEVKEHLDRQANPKPKHAALAFLASPAIALWDGPAGVAEWASTFLTPMEPFYSRENYSGFLAWLIDNSGNDGLSYAIAGTATMRNGDGNGADLLGVTGFLEKYSELSKAGYTPRKIGLVLALGDENAELELSSSGLKVCGLRFPEGIGGGSLDERLEARLEWVGQVETEIAALVKAWLVSLEDGEKGISE